MKQKNLTDFLKTALIPAHRTMYVWGGGWEESGDLGRLGLNPKWYGFYKNSEADYDFKQHKFKKESGLDCSGYVGWVMTNYFGGGDYVTFADKQADLFAEIGLGTVIKNPRCFMPGDIVSGNGHVYIAVGQCADRSLILLHSSPPGVQLCAASARDTDSMAARLVKCYTEKYWPEWSEKFGCCVRGAEYTRGVKAFRWSKTVMSDPDCLCGRSAEKVLEILLKET